jgi:hypothetical protein
MLLLLVYNETLYRLKGVLKKPEIILEGKFQALKIILKRDEECIIFTKLSHLEFSRFRKRNMYILEKSTEINRKLKILIQV